MSKYLSIHTRHNYIQGGSFLMLLYLNSWSSYLVQLKGLCYSIYPSYHDTLSVRSSRADIQVGKPWVFFILNYRRTLVLWSSNIRTSPHCDFDLYINLSILTAWEAQTCFVIYIYSGAVCLDTWYYCRISLCRLSWDDDLLHKTLCRYLWYWCCVRGCQQSLIRLIHGTQGNHDYHCG